MKELIKVVQKAIDEKKGEHPVIFEYHTLNPFIDYVVICSAPRLRQVYAIADNVADRVKEHGYTVRSMEGDKDSSWVLVDLDSIVVHVFQTEERAHFQLEKLYADLPSEDFSL